MSVSCDDRNLSIHVPVQVQVQEPTVANVPLHRAMASLSKVPAQPLASHCCGTPQVWLVGLHRHYVLAVLATRTGVIRAEFSYPANLPLQVA